MTTSGDSASPAGGRRDALPTVALHSPNANSLADLQSIARDLAHSLECARLIASRPREAPMSDADATVVLALVESALISYRRCFTGSKGRGKRRSRLAIDQLIDDPIRPMHERIIELANQHIAHRVSDAEQTMVQAHLTPDGEPHDVLAVVVFTVHLVVPDDVRDGLPDLAAVVLSRVNDAYRACEQQLLTDLRAVPTEVIRPKATQAGQS